MRRYFAVCALAVGLLSLGTLASAQTVHLVLNPSNTTIQWTLPAVAHVVHGTFNLTSGNMDFNQQSGAATGMFVVNEDTGQSGEKTRDGRMKKSILKTAEYPTATFQPQHVTGAFQSKGTSTLVVDGIFHIYGADHPLQLHFNVDVAGNALVATTHFDVPYVTWGMRDPSTLFFRVDKSVHMEVNARGTVQPVP
ncbi:MAG TPA: YceI family protein [Acidobacteriaceae bacterium]|nr:YceI family protein [Acidobacteriaceae bacterium]